jgi:parallel beta-helix repeat protein
MNTIYGNNIAANGYAGINLAAITIDSTVVGCSFNSIYNNNITGNSGEGIQFATSSENSIHDNNITDNGYDGLYLDRGSANNEIVRNNIKNNDRDGIMCVIISGCNTISGNNISDNKHNGITLTLNSNVNIISENNILNNTNGIQISNSEYPSDNTVSGNNITNNNVGIVISQASTNQIYHNNFDNNEIHFLAEISANNLDNGSEGNYWNDYNGTDSNGDGIGDTPYVIDADNQDNYPLMKPIDIPEFPSWTILPLILAITLFSVAVKKKF